MPLLLLVAACSGGPSEKPPADPPAAEAPSDGAPTPRGALTPGDPPRTVHRLTMALNWFPEPEFGGFYDAKETGRYAAAGLDVTILPGGPGAPTLEMLAAGQVDIAITGADDLLLRRSKGLEAVAVFAGFQHTPQGLMAHAESGIKSFSDLGERGGTVAIETGSTFQQFLWKTFPWEGKVKAVPYSGSIGAFAQDPTLVQQGYVTSEPCLAEAKGLKVVFLGGADAGWDPYNSVAVIRSNEQTEPWVRGFRDATKEGWEHYLADPSVANAVITRLNPDMPVDRVGCVTDRQKPYVLGEDGVGAMTEARWQAVAKAMGSIGQPVDPTGAWLP